MKFFTALFLLTFFFNGAKSQSRYLKESGKVYSAILDGLNASAEKPMIIADRTRGKDLKTFRFSDPDYHNIARRPLKITVDSSWVQFLRTVDIAKIARDATIDRKLQIGNRYYLTNLASQGLKKIAVGDSVNSIAYHMLQFSPVLLSKNNKQAICAVTISGPEKSMSAYIIFMQFEKGAWSVYEKIMLYMSC